MKLNKFRNDEFFKLTLACASAGSISMTLFLVYIMPLKDDTFNNNLVFVICLFIPFLFGYFIWYVLFSHQLRKAKTLNRSLSYSILGAFFISFVAALLIGSVLLIGQGKSGLENVGYNLSLLSFYIFIGLIYCTPFCIVFGAILGNLIYNKNNKSLN